MNIALILAAGSGTRMKNQTPKQFIEINDKPLFMYCVETFEHHPDIDMIIIATNEDSITKVKSYCKKFNITKVKKVIKGGISRQKSVYNCLLCLELLGVNDNDNILIQDGARPLVSSQIISNNIEACNKFFAVNTVIPSTDTVIKSNDQETISEIENRNQQYQGQTPQSFKFNIICDAHMKFKNSNDINITDDCRLVMNSGYPIHLVLGNKLNFKVTTPEDLIIFKALVAK